MPRGRFSGPGDHSGPILSYFRHFRARPPICDLNTVTLPHLRLLETSTLCVETRQTFVFATEEMSAVETGQTSLVETGQTSAAETTQMFFLLRKDRCEIVRQGTALSYQ